MAEDLDLETFIRISPVAYGIYLFDTINQKNLYLKELKFNSDINSGDLKNLDSFISENIFKIEKLAGRFIKNITVIIDHKKISYTNLGIKKKNYQETVSRKNFENALVDAKDLFNENFQSDKIIHILLNRYMIGKKNYSSYEDDLIGESFCIELKFISISKDLVTLISNILEKYQIKTSHFLDEIYIRNLFHSNFTNISYAAYKVKRGFNPNEVRLTQRNSKNKGFFEKFFQIFS